MSERGRCQRSRGEQTGHCDARGPATDAVAGCESLVTIYRTRKLRAMASVGFVDKASVPRKES